MVLVLVLLVVLVRTFRASTNKLRLLREWFFLLASSALISPHSLTFSLDGCTGTLTCCFSSRLSPFTSVSASCRLHGRLPRGWKVSTLLEVDGPVPWRTQQCAPQSPACVHPATHPSKHHPESIVGTFTTPTSRLRTCTCTCVSDMCFICVFVFQPH